MKLPGGSQSVLVSEFNKLEDGRYFDVDSSSIFEFDHSTQQASDVQSYLLESTNEDLMWVPKLVFVEGTYLTVS